MYTLTDDQATDIAVLSAEIFNCAHAAVRFNESKAVMAVIEKNAKALMAIIADVARGENK